MRIWGIRIVRGAHAESPGQRPGNLPGVLRIEIQIEKVVRLRIRQRKGFRRRRCNAVDELRQRRVGHQRDRAFAEIVIVQTEDPGVRAEPEFMRADRPGEIVVDEEARRATSLHPGIVKPSERGERRIGAAALQNDGKRSQCLFENRPVRTGFRTRKTPD